MSRSRGGTGGPDPPWKITSIGFPSNTPWSGSPKKLQSYQASIQCWAINGMPAKHHLNGIWLAGWWWWPTYNGIWILPHHQLNKNYFKKIIVNVSGSMHGNGPRFTLYLREPFYHFCKQSRPRSCKGWLIRVYSVCLWNKKCHKHVTNAPKGIGLA